MKLSLAKTLRVLLIASVMLGGCRREAEPDPGTLCVDTKYQLRVLCMKVIVIRDETGGAPEPSDVKRLVMWLEQYGLEDEPYIDQEERRITDAWGNTIVIVHKDNLIVGFGSAGPDGVWQQGGNDDIVITVQSVM